MIGPQKSSRERIEAGQLGSLQQLLSCLVRSNRYYAPILEKAGLDGSIGILQDFTSRMPFTTKHDMARDQQENPPFGTNLTYPLEKYVRFHQTSATTGSPMRWLDTAESWEGLIANWEQIFLAAGVNAADRILFTFSFGPFLGFWCGFDAACRLGCLCIPAGGMSSLARINLLIESGATVLCCTPTYALRLAEVAAEEAVDLSASKIRLLIVAGEPGGSIPSTRTRIESAWSGARVFDHHGMTEVGPVSFESPHHPCVLHVIESSYLAEVIHPETGEPALEGQTGELVLTTLNRHGSPLLRYRTGDLVCPVWSGGELYGRTEVALVGGIIGRVDEMVVIRGVNVCPSSIEGVIRSFSEVGEYRVEVHGGTSMPEMRVVIEADGWDDAIQGVAESIEKQFRLAFNLRIPVSVAPKGALPRSEMKSRRWIIENTGTYHA